VRRSLLALALLLAAPAAADEIQSFAPGDVTVGTELVVRGDFSELAAARQNPRVVGVNPELSGAVVFEVLSLSSGELDVIARRFPERRREPAVGKRWTLVVKPPNGGAALEAPGSFVTVGPELIDARAVEGRPGQVLELLADNLGSGKLSVWFGARKAKLAPVSPRSARESEPVTLPPGIEPTSLFVIVPRLPGGSYPISLRNAVGPSPAPIGFTVLPPAGPPG
jgi:hypothetical protein